MADFYPLERVGLDLFEVVVEEGDMGMDVAFRRNMMEWRRLNILHADEGDLTAKQEKGEYVIIGTCDECLVAVNMELGRCPGCGGALRR